MKCYLSDGKWVPGAQIPGSIDSSKPQQHESITAFPCLLRLFPAVGRLKLRIGTTRLTPVYLGCVFLLIPFIHLCHFMLLRYATVNPI